MAYDIFISYRHDGGKELARPMKSELERRGYRVFLDFDELKDGVFDCRIMEAIDSSPIFMVILSQHSLDRCVNADDRVRKEIEYAIQKNRHFIPVNPDLSFEGFPVQLPEGLKAGLGRHRFSEVMFSQLFMDSIDKMVHERIEPLLQQLGRASAAEAQKQVGALFHVETDMECRILKFGQEIAIARPGDDTTIRLPKGRHKLEIVSLECPDDRLSMTYTVEDTYMVDFIEIELVPMRERREFEAKILNTKADEAYNARDYTEAVRLYRMAAEQGNANAQCSLGFCYDNGKGVNQDYTEAVKWYRKSAEQGHANAQCYLGFCYESGKGVNQDYTEAVKWYRKSAEQGNAYAQCDLGFCYDNGNGVKQDYAEAAKWYRKSAEQGHASAQCYLGCCYDDGEGVNQDYVEAAKWYRMAAEQGHASAQYNLGCCYDNGEGVKQDYVEAAKWYRMAAEQGDADAQFYLGVLYNNGNGVTQDYAEAAKWFRKAAEQGYAKAAEKLEELRRMGIK